MWIAIWAFIVSIIGPIAKRVLIALGIGTLTYVGLDAAFDAAKAAVISNYGQMSADVLNVVSLAGFGQAFGIILGAIAGRLAMIAVSKFAKAST